MDVMEKGSQQRFEGLKRELMTRFAKLKEEIREQSATVTDDLKTDIKMKHKESLKALNSQFKDKLLVNDFKAR